MKAAILTILTILVMTGCASNQIMKECKQIEGTDAMVCKTTLPWEDLADEE